MSNTWRGRGNQIFCFSSWPVLPVLLLFPDGNKWVHSLWIKPTDALNSNFIGITILHVSGSLSTYHQEFVAVNRLWYILLPGVGWNWSSNLLLVANGSSQLHKMYQSRCTVKNSWWWAERLPETCRIVIPIQLEFSASVGFIHKESVTMHGHTIVKPWVHITAFIIVAFCSAIDTYHCFAGTLCDQAG